MVEMQPYNSKVITTFVIDVLSKNAWAVPLKTKNGNEMVTVIAQIIRDDRRCPKNLQTDMRKKFYNANVQKLLKKHNINFKTRQSLFNIP